MGPEAKPVVASCNILRQTTARSNVASSAVQPRRESFFSISSACNLSPCRASTVWWERSFNPVRKGVGMVVPIIKSIPGIAGRKKTQYGTLGNKDNLSTGPAQDSGVTIAETHEDQRVLTLESTAPALH